ncbi:MAG: TonB-dependent receptor [Tannerella sp.]|nr:TonB-dependent receptor [Tannerella sp.]
MRLSLCIPFICVLPLAAMNVDAQNALVKLQRNELTVGQLIKEIERQTDMLVIYRNREVDTERMIRVGKNSNEVTALLDNAFENTDIYYEIENKYILLTKRQDVQQTGKRLAGTVVDTSGETVVGANVIEKGTLNGVATDMDGNFSLIVAENAVLQVSYIGYITQEVSVSSITGNHLVIRLTEDAKALEEVVVVGYGTQIKRNVATAISSVKSDKLDRIPQINAAQAMVGQVSGIRLQQVTGEPGAAPSIRIRGNGSITSSNSPLYVIDGYPTSDASLFNSISLSDIESIDILKDAASAAIYGSRAGNGVVIVTTKQGASGKTNFFANVSYGFQQIQKKIGVLNGQEYVEMATEALVNNGITESDSRFPAIFKNPSEWAETDWQDVIFRTAPVQNYQVGATGGTDKFRFAVSGGYTDQKGTLVNTYLQRYNLKVNMDAQLNKYLKVGLSMLPSYSISRKQYPEGPNTNGSTNGGVIAEALSMPPILPVWFPNGDYYVSNQDPRFASTNPFNYQIGNPLNKLDALNETYNTFQQAASFYLELTPLKGLTVRSTINSGIFMDTKEKYVEAFYIRGGGQNSGNISTPNLAGIDAERKNQRNLNWYWSNTATYIFDLNEQNHFTALLGYDVAMWQKFGVRVTPRTDASNPVAFENTTVKNVQGAILTQGLTSRSEYVFDAVFARLNYDYANKYILSASVRRDRSSRFGPQNRAGVFPSVSAAWLVSEESFMKALETVSLLKIRASYGETGNDQLGTDPLTRSGTIQGTASVTNINGEYAWITSMNKSFYNFGVNDVQVIAYSPGGFSNPNLGWEKNRQFDLGLDIGAFKNRLTLQVDYYKRNSNTILSASIPSLNGKSKTVMTNVGNVENKGMEFTLNTKNFIGDFSWNTDFNISFNRNKITELANGQNQLGGLSAGTFWGNVIRNYVGRPMGDIYMLRVIGTFDKPEDLLPVSQGGYAQNSTQKVGDLRFEDVAGPNGSGPDGVITAEDYTCVGNYQPKFVYGMGNTFSYRHFEFSILTDGVYGNKLIYALERPVSLARVDDNSSKGVLNRWKSESDPGNGRYHRAGNPVGPNVGPNTRYLYDAGFFRIRQLYLAYNLSQRYYKTLGLSSCRVFVSAENLKTFTEYPGYNPEANFQGDNAINNGVDQGSYPLARNVSFGLNITF